jgi:hypothetical protein
MRSKNDLANPRVRILNMLQEIGAIRTSNTKIQIRYYGASYRPYAKRGSEDGQYAPNADVLSRQALEENFRHIKGQRFKEELKRQDSKKSK